ncbi:MAG: DsbA family protein [Pseudomonadota bacterium]
MTRARFLALLTGSLTLCAVALPSLVWLGQTGEAAAQEAEHVEIQDMILGDPDAPVTVIEYASYTCPHCATFHTGTYKDLKKDYIDAGKVRFIFREVYFDRYGLWASMIARCAGPLRFFGVTDLIFENQREWTASSDPAQVADNLRRIGKTAGMSDAQLEECLSNGAEAQALVTWYQDNAQADGISSTPSFVIDGQRYSNMSFGEFSEILDGKLSN